MLTLCCLIFGYAFMRLAYQSTDNFPFTQEIVVIILGTLVTIIITALLLNKQTAVEVQKEQNIKFFELKTQTYLQLLDLLEEMSLVDFFTDKELIRLKFLTHKLSIVASAKVLEKYGNVLKTIETISKDNTFSDDTSILHKELANLSFNIREDILGLNNDLLLGYNSQKMKSIIASNTSRKTKKEIL